MNCKCSSDPVSDGFVQVDALVTLVPNQDYAVVFLLQWGITFFALPLRENVTL